MANQFRNGQASLVVAPTTVYTCPTGRTAVVILCQAANLDTGTAADGWVTAYWTDASATNKVTNLAYRVVVPIAASVGVLTGKLVLEAGDTIVAAANAASKVDFTVSVLEIY